MTTVKYVLAIDMGNTRTHAGVVDIANKSCRVSAAIPKDSDDAELSRLIDDMSKASGVAPELAVCSSVLLNRGESLRKVLAGMGIVLLQVSTGTMLPFVNNYREPERLGSDRVANALFAWEVLGGGPAIIISTGTALVIDLLAPGGYCGGAILPGISMQFKALNVFTDALPHLPVPQDVLPEHRLPGNSTASSISGGILAGTAGAIDAIVNSYRLVDGCNNAPVFATGGDWPLLSGLVGVQAIHYPDMTLIGTALSIKYSGQKN